MNNIQFAAALAAPTGTGLLAAPFSQDKDVVVYRESPLPASGKPKVLQYRRTLPKPGANGFQGMERGEVRYVEYYYDANGTEYVNTISMTSSMAVATPLAFRQAMLLKARLAFDHANATAVVEANTVPMG